jgi:hypothetical protein
MDLISNELSVEQLSSPDTTTDESDLSGLSQLESDDGHSVIAQSKLESLISKLVNEQVQKGMTAFFLSQKEQGRRGVCSTDFYDNGENTPPEKIVAENSLFTPPSQQSVSALSVVGHALLLSLQNLVGRNRRQNQIWDPKTLADVYPILNNNQRLVDALVAAAASAVIELRSIPK